MLYFMRASASLRTRLIAIPSCVLLFGIIATICMTLYQAKDRINSEIVSGTNLGGSLLVEYALQDIETASDPDVSLRRLQRELYYVRHITVRYVSPDGRIKYPPAPHASDGDAPKWFQNLFEPERVVESYPVMINGKPHGELVMSTKPSDEIAEIWHDLTLLTSLLGAISIGVVSLIAFTVRKTLKPLNELLDGLGRLQRSEFSRLGDMRIAELRGIGEQFNRLASSLARTEADNHYLIDRLISIQEGERKELARELHDEFGAALYGIRAAASCIVDDASCWDEEKAKEIIGRAEAISSLADSIQRHNHRILERIRPVILHEIGLFDATRDLIDLWLTAHREFECEVRLPPGPVTLDEEVSLTAYRIVQESLTNVARHSKAKTVRVTLNYRSESGGEATNSADRQSIRVSIEDDGVGLPAGLKFGFGFLGMGERVRKLGGYFKVSNGPRAGALIEAIIPIAMSPQNDQAYRATS